MQIDDPQKKLKIESIIFGTKNGLKKKRMQNFDINEMCVNLGNIWK